MKQFFLAQFAAVLFLSFFANIGNAQAPPKVIKTIGTAPKPVPTQPSAASVNTTNLEAAIVAEVNRMRADPKAYANELAKLVFVPINNEKEYVIFWGNDLVSSPIYKDNPYEDYVASMNEYRSKLQEAIDALYGLSTAKHPVKGPLSQLTRKTELNKACEMLAADMGQINGHNDSKGRDANCRARTAGYKKPPPPPPAPPAEDKFLRVGECLNSNFTSARGFVLSFMTSTGHRKILTDAGYEEIGVDTHYHPKAGDYDDYIRNVIMLGDKDYLAPTGGICPK